MIITEFVPFTGLLAGPTVLSVITALHRVWMVLVGW